MTESKQNALIRGLAGLTGWSDPSGNTHAPEGEVVRQGEIDSAAILGLGQQPPPAKPDGTTVRTWDADGRYVADEPLEAYLERPDAADFAPAPREPKR